MLDWKAQLQNPMLRHYEPIAKHSGGPTKGVRGTFMDLLLAEAVEVLRTAIYDRAKATGGKAPSLWAYHNGKIYRFMWDNMGGWHGYPTVEKPPNTVLQQWRDDGTITEPEYGKIRRYPNRGS